MTVGREVTDVGSELTDVERTVLGGEVAELRSVFSVEIAGE